MLTCVSGFYNWTALHFAAAAGFPGIVDLLVGAGADVNARDVRGQHALFVAAAAGGNYYARIPGFSEADADVCWPY